MIKRILRNWYRYVLWTLLSAVFWAWIFTLLFSAPVKQKVVLYADLPYLDRNALSIELERDKPEGIRIVDTATFDDKMFNQIEVLDGDLYLIPDSEAEEYLASFAPIDRADFPDATFFESDGEAYGILVYDEATGLNVGGAYLFYKPQERCWLFFNKDSMHIGAHDDAAIMIARHFLNLQ
ncbi:MAG: hypothetical protein II412_00100 [Clostridia bacterium]|nr:hypothetical protein [Clostridia bacterium]